MNIITRLTKKLMPSSDKNRQPEVLNCREYLDRKILRMPDPLPNGVFQIDKSINCLEKIPGIMDPLEGYTLFELAKDGAANDPIVEVGSFLGKSTSYLAFGSLISGKSGVIAIDMFPAKADWFKGDDGYWHIKGSDYYLDEPVYREREHFFYGGGYYHDTLEIFTDIAEKVNLKSHITAFKGNSSSYMASADKKQQFRLVFIDGDHTYQGVKKDIEALCGSVVAGGHLCFHDYGSSFPGVVKAVDELILSSDAYRHRCLVKSLMVVKKV